MHNCLQRSTHSGSVVWPTRARAHALVRSCRHLIEHLGSSHFASGLLLFLLSALPTFAMQVATGNITSQVNSFLTLAIYVCAAFVAVSLGMTIFKFISRDASAGIGWAVTTVIAGIIVGYAISWTASSTGVTVGGGGN